MADRSAIGHFPQWFVAIFALIYFSGYLIDFFYYSSLGITDPGSEPLKLHYIQIGLVFLLGHALIVSLFVFMVFGAARMYRVFWKNERPISRILASFMVIFFSLSVYLAVIFTSPQYLQFNPRHLYAILKLIGFFTAGLVIVLGIEGVHLILKKSVASGRRSRAQTDKLQFLVEVTRGIVIGGMIATTLYIDIEIFKDLFDDLTETFTAGGWAYFALAVIFSLILFRTITRLEDTNKAARDANESPPSFSFAFIGVASLACGILVMFFFLSLVSYAHAIFPYIPYANGGADYTAAPRAEVTLRPHGLESDAHIFATDVLILYTTSTAIYFASYKGSNDPCKWRARTEKPKVIGVMRTEIQSITAAAAPSRALHPNCNVP